MVVSQTRDVRERRPPEAVGDRSGDEFDTRTCRAETGCPRAVADVAGARDACEAALSGMQAGAILRAKADGPFREHHRLKVAVCGCPNQCSRPQIADVGFVGQRVPGLDLGACIACGLCVETCAEAALTFAGDTLEFCQERCEGCGMCITVCPTGALTVAEEGWRVLVGGRLGRHPRLAARVEACVPVAQAVDDLAAVLRVYGEQGGHDERIGAALDRLAGVSEGVDDPAREEERRRSQALADLLGRAPEVRSEPETVGRGRSR